jgi:hypothetical protein
MYLICPVSEKGSVLYAETLLLFLLPIMAAQADTPISLRRFLLLFRRIS